MPDGHLLSQTSVGGKITVPQEEKMLSRTISSCPKRLIDFEESFAQVEESDHPMGCQAV